METALTVTGLSVELETAAGRVRPVENVSFQLTQGETLAVVGESGCGKSMMALSLLRLAPPGSAYEGSIRLGQEELLGLPEKRMRQLRGGAISMIFQEPMTSLNPVLTIGEQIAEVLIVHSGLSRRSALDRAAALLDQVRIRGARHRLLDYPHQLSGGMRQRVMLAMALACEPRVLIADEPTTALDVTVQAQVLDLLVELQAKLGMAMILISHDLATVSQMAGRTMVMYAGRVIEEGATRDLLVQPRHPYTQGLLSSTLEFRADGSRPSRLRDIPGIVPPLHLVAGRCAFCERCPTVMDICWRAPPPRRPAGPGRAAACHALAEEV